MKLSQSECIAILENIRWSGIPQCPYCESLKSRKLKNESRYQCNDCYTSYSVTVGTIFHKTHVELWKWFLAIQTLEETNGSISARQLASAIGVNKNTANRMIQAIQDIPTAQGHWILKLKGLVK